MMNILINLVLVIIILLTKLTCFILYISQTELILGCFRSYYSTLVEDLVKMLPKPTNKYYINTVIKYHEHMILGDIWHILRKTQL